MPPHCDTLDGPVVKAAKAALEADDVNLILPWVPEAAEDEVKEAFESVVTVKKHCEGFPPGVEVAERWLFETVVRLHRAGEGAPYTGLKPEGLSSGPVVPRAEKAIETGDASDVIAFISRGVEEEVSRRFKEAIARQKYDADDVPAAREYVEAMLSFLLYSHGVYKFIKSDTHHSGSDGKKKEAGGHKH